MLSDSTPHRSLLQHILSLVSDVDAEGQKNILSLFSDVDAEGQKKVFLTI